MKKLKKNIGKIPLSVSVRIFIFLSVTFFSLKFLKSFSTELEFDKKEILSLLISVISIIIAIVITYLFSKLFAEKSERIQRKAEIDLLSHKITAFRKIAFHIRGFHDFWKFGKNNIKSKMDHKYNHLVYEDLRNDKYSYDELTPVIRDVGETAIQAYLGLKGLENNENSFGFFQSFNPKNYSLDEIARFEYYTNSFWYLLDRSSDNIVNFNNVSRYSLDFIDELYFEITSKKINQDEYKRDLKELFGHFETEIYQKHYYLSRLNSTSIPKVFISSLLNMLIFILTLISGIFIFIADFDSLKEYLFTMLIVSLFIANTFDLLILTITSLKSELKINEFYKI